MRAKQNAKQNNNKYDSTEHREMSSFYRLCIQNLSSVQLKLLTSIVIVIFIIVLFASHLSTVRKSREIYNVIQFKY